MTIVFSSSAHACHGHAADRTLCLSLLHRQYQRRLYLFYASHQHTSTANEELPLHATIITTCVAITPQTAQHVHSRQFQPSEMGMQVQSVIDLSSLNSMYPSELYISALYRLFQALQSWCLQ